MTAEDYSDKITRWIFCYLFQTKAKRHTLRNIDELYNNVISPFLCFEVNLISTGIISAGSAHLMIHFRRMSEVRKYPIIPMADHIPFTTSVKLAGVCNSNFPGKALNIVFVKYKTTLKSNKLFIFLKTLKV